MKLDIYIMVVADKFANFASHCIYEATKRGYGNSIRKVVSYQAYFLGAPNLRFYWANHNDLSTLGIIAREHYDEIHLAGPEIDEDMIDIFEVFREQIKKQNSGIVKVVVDERDDKKRK